MSVSVKTFFQGLNVNTRYYIKQFESFGIQNRFFFSEDDLMIIVNNLPRTRYKSALVVKRAFDLLEAEDV